MDRVGFRLIKYNVNLAIRQEGMPLLGGPIDYILLAYIYLVDNTRIYLLDQGLLAKTL